MGDRMPNMSRIKKYQEKKKRKDFGLRKDGTPKSTGHLGKLTTVREDGKSYDMTELSVLYNGRFMPTITPRHGNETKQEHKDRIDFLVNKSHNVPMEELPDEAFLRAVEYAKYRESKGKPAFFNKGEHSKKIWKDHKLPRYDDNMNEVVYKKKKGEESFGIPVVKSPDNLTKWYEQNKNVSGMYHEGDDVITVSPYYKGNRESLIKNEGFRGYMLKNNISIKEPLTKKQEEFLGEIDYDPAAWKQTIYARRYSGDPSAQDFTKEQDEELNKILKKYRNTVNNPRLKRKIK